jgi:hypothetical protein
LELSSSSLGGPFFAGEENAFEMRRLEEEYLDFLGKGDFTFRPRGVDAFDTICQSVKYLKKDDDGHFKTTLNLWRSRRMRRGIEVVVFCV